MPEEEAQSERKSGPIRNLVRDLLSELGEDPGRDGLQRTPIRVEESLRHLTSGYGQDPAEVLRRGSFKEEYDEMIVVRDIALFSLCEHHLLPFYGKAHVAYIPSGKLVGLSKIPRVVDIFARRLQVQERLTNQIARCIQEVLNPQGVGVVIEALHLCMAMRGVEKQDAITTTSAVFGVFREDRATRSEFLSLITSSSGIWSGSGG